MNNIRSKIVPKEAVPTLELDGCVTYEEELPYPIVHYPSRFGSFFGFQENENTPVCNCKCQQKGLEIYLLNEEFNQFGDIPKSLRFDLGEAFINTLQFKDNLCHVCNKVCPKYGFGKTSNGTKFHSIYGHYINGLSFGFGIGSRGRIYAPELLPLDIVPYLITHLFDDKRLDDQSITDFLRYCEDVIRIRMGYFAIGKKWTTEVKLLEIIKKLYPNYIVIHQYPLDHLKADIFIEELNLVIEYQGEQHFKPIAFMGGEKAFENTKARDKEKAELCDYYKLGIVYFDYKDELNEKMVKERISLYLKGKK
ncbi:hypothetical protein [Domibacillus antri]|uniref:hypothetical protein n=1 Tax=Domibacillus antri TaxID=1714264 RepID=UPI000A7B3D9F|nr:hypothetical protein [Domibacillus antri]